MENKNQSKKIKIRLSKNSKSLYIIFAFFFILFLTLNILPENKSFDWLSFSPFMISGIVCLYEYFSYQRFAVIDGDKLIVFKNKNQIENEIKLSDISEIKTNYLTSRIEIKTNTNKEFPVITFAPNAFCYLCVTGLIYIPYVILFNNTAKLFIAQINKHKYKSEIGLYTSYKYEYQNYKRSLKGLYIYCWIINGLFVLIFAGLFILTIYAKVKELLTIP